MIDLNKKAEAVGIVLTKRGVTAPPIVRVAAMVDVSGSMADEFADGSTQKVFDQLMGVGYKLDDDGQVDVWSFNHDQQYIGTANPGNFANFMKKLKVTGGTNYGPVLKAVMDFMFAGAAPPAKTGGFFGLGKKAAGSTGSDETPVLAIMITDGESGDSYNDLVRIMKDAQSKNIYFQMVGINNQGEQFRTLRKLADEMDNVGFIRMNGFNVTDEQLYEELMSVEFAAFLKKWSKVPA